MSEYFALLKRELRSVVRERTIVFAIAVQFFIASFSSVVLIGIMAFYDPTSIADNTRVQVRVGVVGDLNSPMVGYLREAGVGVDRYRNLDRAEAAFRGGNVDAVMFVPEARTGVVDMKLIVPEWDVKKTVVLMVLDGPLKRYENYLREANGVRLEYAASRGQSSTTYEFLYSIIIPILVLFPALIAGSMTIDAVSEELENKTFDTLMAAPVSLGQVFASKITAAVITAGVQVAMWAGLLRINNLVIHNLGAVLTLAVVMAATVSVGTAIISLYFKDRERAQFVYSILLIAVAGGSSFLNPSPFGLITRLAAGDPNIGGGWVLLYALPLLAIGGAFLATSRRLALARR